MRRSASFLLVCVSLTLTAASCRAPEKQTAADRAANMPDEAYFQPAYEEPAEDYDPYVVEPSASLADSSYAATAPAAPTSASRYHTVVKGDTLYGLARAYYGDQRRWKDVYEANRAVISDPNKIRIGQRLLIP